MRAAGLPVIRGGAGRAAAAGLVTVEFVGGYSVALSRPFGRSERARARARVVVAAREIETPLTREFLVRHRESRDPRIR